ncbi:MAG: TIGR04282 family arsenosugar biosynthesis glycosyltransferase [Desulfosalsimonadaceae bacterium]|nr:TIGR04282 family arsenosugar biosynthesis glycosyltransferase [Desulfosalsimonadaceae bacterium]
MNCNSSCVILFIKAPVAGQVKTRLARRLGVSAAALLYRCFVNDLVRKIDAANLPLHIFYDPPDAEAAIRNWLGEERAYAPQTGDDLGERMKQAFQQVFSEGIKRAVLVGSDLPDLPAEIAADALTALNQNPAVIGPSKDGGYYLIGFRADAFTPTVFDGVPWSSGRVLQTTLERFAAAGLPVLKVPEWRDIDTPEDLTDLIASLKKHPENAPETFAYLRKID